MSSYSASVRWVLGDGDFSRGRYTRAHEWHFDGGTTVPASASPHVVPLPHSDAAAVDPEEAFVAALASCHMLFFLSLAAKAGVTVESYSDDATGELETGADGRGRMTSVTLRPAARYAGGDAPSGKLLAKLHGEAHELCYIANSVTTDVRVELVS